MAPSPSEIYAAVRLYRRHHAQQHSTIPHLQGDSLTDRSNARCVYCNRNERLLTFQQLKPGDHICMGGAKLQFNLGAKQVNLYTHDAIVKQVEFIDDSRAILTLIHFIDTPYDKTLKIQETREMRNLFNDDIYVVKYRHQTRDVDDIICRAESLIQMGIPYSVLTFNNETLAHFCVIGQMEAIKQYQTDISQCKIDDLRMIGIGDVVSFKFLGMAHDGIVSSVKVLPITDGQQGQFKIIYYALPGSIRPREIREDTVDIDLNNTCFKQHDYTGYDIHPPNKVIERARMRIGETKFSIFSNRSYHFCHWAKVKESPMPMPYQEEGRVDFMRSLQSTDVVTNLVYADHRRGANHATMTLPTKRVIIGDDVTKGQLIQFKYNKLWHKAICTDVKAGDNPYELTIYIVHYGRNNTVTEESMTFDLRQKEIYIYNFHPLYKYREDEVIKRARGKIGEQNYNLCTRRSSHLAEEAICKDKDKRVVRLNEIQKGDVIIFRYWSLMHEAIVPDVIIDDAKPNYIGSIKIIHYALPSLFSTREILEEIIHVHLQRDSVYIKSFRGYTTYPNDMVVRRARDRLGERKFHPRHNTSFDFVHWAKVIQQPSVISMNPVDEAGIATRAARREVVLVPRVGPTCEEFQVDWIKTWDELKPGNIVQYRYYLLPHSGIVSAVHPSLNEVTVIHYGTATIFSKRTIMMENVRFDLKTDLLRVYRCDPAKCHPLETVVENAKMRVGEQGWSNGNRTWDFCKACTLKK